MQLMEERGMDDRRFDELARRLGGGRRRFLKQVVGLGGAAVVGRLAIADADAARRGYGGPPLPAPATPPSITIVFRADAGGGCIPHGRLVSFPRNSQLNATWYVFVGSERSGPFVSLAITDQDGSGDATFGGTSVAPGPNVTVSVEVSGVTASAPVSCSS
jgi:hypothetical protein